MYNVDDAIAKIDGYVISISGGGPFVGESKLIKIDEVRAHRGLREHRDQQRRCPGPARGRRRRADADEAARPADARAGAPMPTPAARRGRRRSQATIQRLAGQDAAVAAEAAGGVRALRGAAAAEQARE